MPETSAGSHLYDLGAVAGLAACATSQSTCSLVAGRRCFALAVGLITDLLAVLVLGDTLVAGDFVGHDKLTVLNTPVSGR